MSNQFLTGRSAAIHGLLNRNWYKLARGLAVSISWSSGGIVEIDESVRKHTTLAGILLGLFILTGTTASATEAMAKALNEHGHQCHVQSVAQADPDEVSQADLICIGSWVKGLFIILQHPTEQSMHFIDRLGDLTGKKAVVFCTYKLAVGSTLARIGR